jgi:hypothetical protein
MKRVILSFVLIFGSLAQAAQMPFPTTPNPKTSPGGVCNSSDSDYRGLRYTQKIPVCDRNVTDGMKHAVYQAYGIPLRCKDQFTVDHIIPLSIGGSNRIENLWPEHRRVKATRLEFETEIHLMVQEGRINQRDAIDQVRRIKFTPAIAPIKAYFNCN